LTAEEEPDENSSGKNPAPPENQKKFLMRDRRPHYYGEQIQNFRKPLTHHTPGILYLEGTPGSVQEP
jgi:hypothetical protein